MENQPRSKDSFGRKAIRLTKAVVTGLAAGFADVEALPQGQELARDSNVITPDQHLPKPENTITLILFPKQ